MKRFTIEDFAQMERIYRGNFINSLSGFKSVCLVGTISNEGQHNLSIFSQVFHLGASPALMGMIVRPDVSPRHTLENIQTTKFFTLNHIHSDFFKKAHQTSARYPREVSEFEAVGLTPSFDYDFAAPFVKESHLKIGLRFEEQHDLSINNTHLIIGRVEQVILQEEIVAQDGYLDIEKAGSITCSGLDSYHITQRLERLRYAKV